MQTIRWGVLGPGGIAEKFVRSLAALDDHLLVAAGSRDRARARGFVDRFGGGAAYGSYEELVAAPEVDVVYVATPHPFHREHATLALVAGKAVLCEKPLCINRLEGEAVVAASAASGSFLLEGMWTRFLPVYERVEEWIRGGAIGEPRLLSSDFGFRFDWDPTRRQLALELGGGALLDLGVYNLALASMLFGFQPVAIAAEAHLGASGVDEQNAVVLRYAGGEMAVLHSAARVATPHLARIEGTAGRIEIPRFSRATSATLIRPGREPETVEAPFAVNGFEYEAAEVARCLRAGLRESPRMPHAESLGILTLMDRARAQIGLRYPGEGDDVFEGLA